jgi:hypothetical protein
VEVNWNCIVLIQNFGVLKQNFEVDFQSGSGSELQVIDAESRSGISESEIERRDKKVVRKNGNGLGEIWFIPKTY